MSRNINSKINNKNYLTIKQHISKYKYNNLYKLFKQLCKYSKNLYNNALYIIRQYFFNTGKYRNYLDLQKELQGTYNYKQLEANCSCNILHIVDENFKSFFTLKEKGIKCKIPKYLDKDDYFNVCTHKVHIQNNKWIIPLSKNLLNKYGFNNKSKNRFKIKIPTILKDKKIKYINIIPKYEGISFEIHYVYEINIKKEIKDNNNYLSIDLGVNNLCTCVHYKSNEKLKNIFKSFIIDGKKLKSINQYYNKYVSLLQKKNNNNQFTKRMYNILKKRNNQINDYIHKSCNYIINYCLNNNINTIILGWNIDFQRNIIFKYFNKSKKRKAFNQYFSSIPFSKLKNNLEYRCKINNIQFILQEESFTSKASFIDNDYLFSYIRDEDNKIVLRTLDNKVELKKIEFVGKRKYRGLYISKNGIKINADINGSLNIMKKYLMRKKYEENLQNIESKIVNSQIYEGNDIFQYSNDMYEDMYEDMMRVLYYRGKLVVPLRIKLI